ncbi:tRNA (adenosine(37)-N6)-threonylcarbamoyltransferase complex dimerization subunit type 1 TsaB [Thiomicrorhabdus sp. 6S3-12]|uniref:tRNA (adenosine(37)-N6)-threonylcarbamoyltransferase complex dimerization subunit type 1 TsaB n=1 Tax=Thiomicrorhabdus sp. 6S3-12 TaxID=2819681 RepID=UPI001AAD5E55|nr:tRNA (adenosine(37)-N6)-threonylcarbamoyltransferase complex dimerization subunit type 1 TsaB [Thiomicrorhabdus sp. 6S3-12]MBO1925004.1 tRNA (adenosine(37)-N6)-threonylcarbamoyltransferase complex dimerization subunit type 1 TsaB [Thiomicrorhabdus sp. 6S3-12]
MSNTQKTILAIDTSTVACSVALRHQEETYAIHEMTPQKHAHRVLPMIDELLQQAGIHGESVDLIAYGEGPGAFTGVRIAAGVTQGLALGWNSDFVGISSLEAMAYQSVLFESRQKPLQWCALMDARMNEIYLQQGLYDPAAEVPWQAEKAVLISPLEVIEQLEVLQRQAQGKGHGFLIFGDITREYPEIADNAAYREVQPNAMAMLNLAGIYLSRKQSLQQGLPVPLYLRNQVAETIQERQAKQLLKEQEEK